MSKFCPNCGNEMRSNESLFCNRCGYKLPDENNNTENVKVVSQQENISQPSESSVLQPKGINFLQDQATKIDEAKKKSNNKTTVIVVIVASILVIVAIILSVYVLFFTDSKNDDSSNSSLNNSTKNSSSQVDSSETDSSYSDLNSSTGDYSEPDSSSEPEIEITPIQKRDIESVVAKKSDIAEKYDSKQYTTLINADEKTVIDCLNKYKEGKQAVGYYKEEKGPFPTITESFEMQDIENHATLITVKTIQKEEFFKNINNLTITFHEGKLYDKKDEFLKALLNPELAEYIINGEVDKNLDFNISYYLNNKEIRVDYKRAKQEKDYVINITYTVMSNTDEDKEALDGQNHLDMGFSLLNDIKTPLSAFFTTKSKEPTDFDSIKSNKSLFNTAVGYLKTDKPVVLTKSTFDSITVSGTRKILKFHLVGYFNERMAGDASRLEFELWLEKDKPSYCGVTMALGDLKAKNDVAAKVLNTTTDFLYPGLKVDAQGIGEITINGEKYKVEMEKVNEITRRIHISRTTK